LNKASRFGDVLIDTANVIFKAADSTDQRNTF
jgi:hypothetical protein